MLAFKIEGIGGGCNAIASSQGMGHTCAIQKRKFENANRQKIETCRPHMAVCIATVAVCMVAVAVCIALAAVYLYNCKKCMWLLGHRWL